MKRLWCSSSAPDFSRCLPRHEVTSPGADDGLDSEQLLAVHGYPRFGTRRPRGGPVRRSQEPGQLAQHGGSFLPEDQHTSPLR
jgi:hypothetical protein